ALERSRTHIRNAAQAIEEAAPPPDVGGSMSRVGNALQAVEEGDAPPDVVDGAAARGRLGTQDRVLLEDVPAVVPGPVERRHDPGRVDVARAERTVEPVAYGLGVGGLPRAGAVGGARVDVLEGHRRAARRR